MKGLLFNNSKPIEPSLPSRMDIALFVGFVSRRSNSAVPEPISKWLIANCFNNSDELLNVPVPIENWDIFDQLFSWDNRTVVENEIDDELKIDTYLGAAVHSFFQQGGKKCYVVRAGDNIKFGSSKAERNDLLQQIVPGYFGSPSAYADDRLSWFGIAYLYGLPDVAILSIPDLPELVAAEAEELSTEIPEKEVPPEQFVECSGSDVDSEQDDASKYLLSPRCSSADYTNWIALIHHIAVMLENPKSGRATQLLASVPLPQEGTDAHNDMNAFLAANISGSVFVQLVYPWVKMPAHKLPEDLNVPEGVVAGLLARNAILRGSFRTICQLPLFAVDDVFPQLSNKQRYSINEDYDLSDRVSLFDMTINGVRLISDVTSSKNIDYRQANVARIVSMLVRESRRIGEAMVFESSGEQLWRNIIDRLTVFLTYLYRAGALNGANAVEAFHVRCDRSTMTQNDIDNGRVIVQVLFSAATSIESIIVTLTMDHAGQNVGIAPQITEVA